MKITLAALAFILAGSALAATVETTPVPRQGLDTWGWWKRCGDVRNTILKGSNTTYDVVFVGDSITHFWERQTGKAKDGPYADLRKEFRILNLGFAGDRTQNVLWRFRCAQQLEGYKAKLFMLAIGINNFGPSKVEDVEEGIRQIIAEIRTAHPESKVLLLPVFVNGKSGTKPHPKSRYMMLDGRLPALADGETVVFHDINRDFLAEDGTIRENFLVDGLHLTTYGYTLWRDAVRPLFRRYCGAAADATPAK